MMINTKNFFSVVIVWRLTQVSCSDGVRQQSGTSLLIYHLLMKMSHTFC